MGVLDISFAGRSFKFDDKGGDDLVAQGMVNGSFETPLPILVMAMLDRLDGVFLDVGANSGIYSVLAGITRPSTKVIAFEPFPAAIAAYENNISLNGLQTRVMLKKIGLSDKSGSAEFFVPDQAHGFLESSCSLERDFKGGEQSSINIDIKTLDELNINDTIAVVKADIEGHEHAFLSGASKTIRRDRPVIFVEVLPPANFKSLQAFLQQNDYLDFRLRPNSAIRDHQVRFDETAWNHAFIPTEKLNVFNDACLAHGLGIVEHSTSVQTDVANLTNTPFWKRWLRLPT